MYIDEYTTHTCIDAYNYVHKTYMDMDEQSNTHTHTHTHTHTLTN